MSKDNKKTDSSETSKDNGGIVKPQDLNDVEMVFTPKSPKTGHPEVHVISEKKNGKNAEDKKTVSFFLILKSTNIIQVNKLT